MGQLRAGSRDCVPPPPCALIGDRKMKGQLPCRDSSSRSDKLPPQPHVQSPGRGLGLAGVRCLLGNTWESLGGAEGPALEESRWADNCGVHCPSTQDQGETSKGKGHSELGQFLADFILLWVIFLFEFGRVVSSRLCRCIASVTHLTSIYRSPALCQTRDQGCRGENHGSSSSHSSETDTHVTNFYSNNSNSNHDRCW